MWFASDVIRIAIGSANINPVYTTRYQTCLFGAYLVLIDGMCFVTKRERRALKTKWYTLIVVGRRLRQVGGSTYAAVWWPRPFAA